MHSLLNKERPPVFCPGCSHEKITHGLDKAFQNMDLNGNEIVIVSDIGCSGLFDTFFNTHAFHGLHGRALTYATGLKMSRPELNVIVTMGDGGLGIGGAHLLSTCRKNIDITLLILNNFNYGMTGGQCSSTTPNNAIVGSSFLNQLEKPLDVCHVAKSAGAGYVKRCSAYRNDLPEEIEKAIRFNGFSIMDIWGICPGRFTKRNKLTPKIIEESLAQLPEIDGEISVNLRSEYGRHYRELAEKSQPVPPPVKVEPRFVSPIPDRQEVIILGSAGQRIVTAGELICLAGLFAGLNVTQKNDYPITVLRGHSISEVVLSQEIIGFSGIDRPNVILALANEGVSRRLSLFEQLDKDTLIIKSGDVDIPENLARIVEIDFKAKRIKPQDRALAALGTMARLDKVITPGMLKSALNVKFKNSVLTRAVELLEKTD